MSRTRQVVIRYSRQYALQCALMCSLLWGMPSAAFAMGSGGKLRQYTPVHQWATEKPQVVVAFGLIQQKTVLNHYVDQFSHYFQSKLRQIDPRIEVKVIPYARGREVVQAFLDRNTVGLIFVSHTYQSEVGSVALTADGYPLPTKILSAATPALRFVAFFGCHGPGFLEQYQVDTELRSLPGSPLFFYSEDPLLNVNYLHGDTIKTLEKKMLEVLRRLTPEQLSGGLQPDILSDGALTIEVKDVVPVLEPRYVYVNDHIVGLLGSDAKDDTNTGVEYATFRYKVPARALQTTRPNHRVTIRAADTSPIYFVDNYLIRSLSLETPEKVHTHLYTPEWRIGDASLKPLPYPIHLTGRPEENAQALNDYLHTFGSDLTGHTKEESQLLYQEFINSQWRKIERIDPDSTHWINTTYKGRSFFDGNFNK